VDILPIFYTGVPNIRPYQLATGKNGDPLATGKPFINNFLPTLSDALRLNMAVPATPRNDPNFSSLGIVSAAVLGLTDPAYANPSLQFIPNMDGFPNGRRLEDDVTTIELQAVSGVALAAIGLWYDDYTSGNPVTPNLLSVLTFNAGVTHNDTTFQGCFPYVQQPWRGFNGPSYSAPTSIADLGMSSREAIMVAYPNPFNSTVNMKYKIATKGMVQIQIADINGKIVATISEGNKAPGEYTTKWNGSFLSAGTYYAKISVDNRTFESVKLVKVK
jgi:hypothetical protein